MCLSDDTHPVRCVGPGLFGVRRAGTSHGLRGRICGCTLSTHIEELLEKRKHVDVKYETKINDTARDGEIADAAHVSNRDRRESQATISATTDNTWQSFTHGRSL